MKADYSNWVPKKMIYQLLGGAVVGWFLFLIIVEGNFLTGSVLKTILEIIFVIVAVLFTIFTLWMTFLHKAFSYDGKRQMSRQIVYGVADYVKVPNGGKILDVGCGSGALTIACAKKNPGAKVTGIDRWGIEYANFSKRLCENNALAEGVTNISFEPGNALKLDFEDETFDAVTSNYVYHNILSNDRQSILLETLRVLKKGGTFAIHDIMSSSKYGDIESFANKLREMGYEHVELIDTTDGKFMSRAESVILGLSGSKILYGTK